MQGPCQHNFCLACFKRWLGQGKKTCPTCRAGFPAKFCDNPRINTLLTYAIRCAKQGIKDSAPKAYNRIAGVRHCCHTQPHQQFVFVQNGHTLTGWLQTAPPAVPTHS
jgi:hypothetical protein